MKVNVISKFDLDSELFEAKRRCEWFIDGMGKHGLTVELFSMMSTEEICLIYNVELSYFKKDDGGE
jgi:hypothetical protein